MGAPVWFGPYGSPMWMQAPLKGASIDTAGVLTVTQFTNGGARVARGGRSQSPSWSWMGNRADLDVIRAVLEGAYGPAPYFYADPTVTNQAPAHWAAPALRLQNWPQIMDLESNSLSTVLGTRAAVPNPNAATKAGAPQILRVTTPLTGLPASSYPRLTLPVPPGYWLHTKHWGTAPNGSTIRANWSAVLTGSGVNPTITSDPFITSGSVRSFAGSSYNYVQLYYSKTTEGAEQVDFIGLAAVLTQSATPPNPFNWTPGGGYTGLDLASYPSMSAYYGPNSTVLSNLEVKLQEVDTTWDVLV